MNNSRTRINQWLALIITALVLGACSLISPTQALSPGWITVQGNLVSFQVPSKWNATPSLPGDESNEEGWLLDIPDADHASISFSGAGLERFHPPSELLISEELITIGTQPGFKWVRFASTAKDQIVYEYMTTGPSGKGIFGLSVVMQAQDPEIEQLLDQLIESVIFSKSKSQSLLPSEDLPLSSIAIQTD
jgi:hypothetical protein